MTKTALLFFMLAGFSAFGQKPTQKKPQQAPTQTQTKPQPQSQGVQPDTVPQINPILDHYIKKSALANRWNDGEAVKNALYDLIVEFPGNDSIVFALAVYYYDNRNYVSSVLVAQDLLGRVPKNISVLQLLGEGYEALSLRDKAVASYEAVYLQNNSTAILFKMAVLQFELQRFPECKANVDILMTKPDLDSLKATITDSDNKQKDLSLRVSILNLKGLLAQQAGDKPAAKKAFEETIALAPDFQLAKQSLAKLK
jgi:tetratricopeptide (TPR) repeat protein